MHVIGQNVDLTYPYNYLGEGAADLGAALKDQEWLQSFKEAKFPVVLVGPGILQRPDRNAILQQARVCMHGAPALQAPQSALGLLLSNEYPIVTPIRLYSFSFCCFLFCCLALIPSPAQAVHL